MPTPFPGMAPYLERPGLWEQVHTGLIVGIQQYLAPRLSPRSYVAIEHRTYLALTSHPEFAGKPDGLIALPPPSRATSSIAVAEAPIEIRPLVGELPMPEEIVQRSLEIRDPLTAEVITVIELLSPSNKLAHQGREQYEQKRLKVLASTSHLIEIDLLRVGTPLPYTLPDNSASGDYRIVISRASQRPKADIYLFTVRDPIPSIPVPLHPNEEEPRLPLNQLLHTLYDQAIYNLAINYHQPPQPPLNNADAAWATRLITAHLES
jgi:hypothetical protein